MKKINKEQVLLCTIFAFLIFLTIESILWYDHSSSNLLMIASYVCIGSFSLMLSTRQNYWVLFTLSFLLLTSMPSIEELFLFPRIYHSNDPMILYSHGNEGVFTQMGRISISIYGFLIPIIIVFAKVVRWVKNS